MGVFETPNRFEMIWSKTLLKQTNNCKCYQHFLGLQRWFETADSSRRYNGAHTHHNARCDRTWNNDSKKQNNKRLLAHTWRQENDRNSRFFEPRRDERLAKYSQSIIKHSKTTFSMSNTVKHSKSTVACSKS